MPRLSAAWTSLLAYASNGSRRRNRTCLLPVNSRALVTLTARRECKWSTQPESNRCRPLIRRERSHCAMRGIGQHGGIRTLSLRVRTAAHIRLRFVLMAASEGLEPSYPESESGVLAAERQGNKWSRRPDSNRHGPI